MAALVAVAGVNAGADETVADVHTAAQGGFHIGAIEGVNVYCVVCAGLLGSVDQFTHYFVTVGAAGVFGADGNLLFGALQTVAHAAHVHGDGFRDAGREAEPP